MLELLECWFALSEEVLSVVDGAWCCWLVGLIVPQFVLPGGAAAAAVAVVIAVAVCFALPDEATAPSAETTVVSAGGVVDEEEEEVDEIDTFGVVMLVVITVVTVDSFNAGSLTDSFMLV